MTQKEGEEPKEVDELCFRRWIFPGEVRSYDSFYLSSPEKESPDVTIIARVDSKNLIEESDENNNEKKVKIDYFEVIKKW